MRDYRIFRFLFIYRVILISFCREKCVTPVFIERLLYYFYIFFYSFLKFFLNTLRIFKKIFGKFLIIRAEAFSRIIITFLPLISFGMTLYLCDIFRRDVNLTLIRSRILRISYFLPAFYMRSVV